jgi:amidase
MPGPRHHVEGSGTGPLVGLRLAVKDLIDVAGAITSFGTVDLSDGVPAKAHATAVEALLQAGASVVGKTVTDEISLGLLGRNRHVGTPINPLAPDRMPGGSSSGTAVAVAAGHSDLGLGSDSGGSVRVPASFPGLWGLRPSHGAIDVAGLMTSRQASTCREEPSVPSATGLGKAVGLSAPRHDRPDQDHLNTGS